MSPYQSFLASNDTYSEYNWTAFVRELPNILIEDPNLEKIFSEFPFFTEKQDEIKLELIDEIYDEFEYWIFYVYKDEYSEEDFYDLIYHRSSLIFKEIIAKYAPGRIRGFEIYNPEIWTVDDIRNYEDENNEAQETDDGSDLEDDIKKAEIKLSNFSFDRKELEERCKKWSYQPGIPFRKPIIRNVPLIKKVNYFDPEIYEVIKKEPSLLKTMDWRLFEEMLADILRRFKYSVELTKATKDGGIDIIAIKKDENFGMHKYLLQAKRYAETVQVSPVRELLFLHDEYKATKSCLATTARFTSGAWELAENHKWKMELKDQQGILQWINKVTSTNLK